MRYFFSSAPNVALPRDILQKDWMSSDFINQKSASILNQRSISIISVLAFLTLRANRTYLWRSYTQNLIHLAI